jgi:outer membrane protein assembly factor BamE (lipoprotein component of BamABCDE complex)
MKRKLVWIVLALAGCVNTDPDTGKTLPRGGQKFEFATVERRAERLQPGMTKLDVLLLLGSPAETSGDNDVWVYLPERPAALIPSRGLRLTFENNFLMRHDFTPIVFGQTL